ncbi:MAG: hypothetical protein ACO2ZA_08140 [Litorivicinaceae bacterium]
MKSLVYLLLAGTAFLCAENAEAAKSKCDFSRNSTDSSTGIRTVQTEWDPLVTIIMGAESEAYASFSVISRGDQKILAVRLDAMDHVPLPAEFAVHEDPTWDPAHRDFLDGLLGDTVIFPEGSSLRLDLDDQTSVKLTKTDYQRVRTNYAKPGESLTARTSQQKVAKGVMGFLAKQALGADEVTEEVSPHYTVMAKAVLEYPIDSESETILSKAAVTTMRVESRDRYYTLGWTSAKDQVFSWNKKSYFKIRDALQCVNKEMGQVGS